MGNSHSYSLIWPVSSGFYIPCLWAPSQEPTVKLSPLSYSTIHPLAKGTSEFSRHENCTCIRKREDRRNDIHLRNMIREGSACITSLQMTFAYSTTINYDYTLLISDSLSHVCITSFRSHREPKSKVLSPLLCPKFPSPWNVDISWPRAPEGISVSPKFASSHFSKPKQYSPEDDLRCPLLKEEHHLYLVSDRIIWHSFRHSGM